MTRRKADSMIPAMQHWLVKSEPESYSWTTFAKEARAAWTGVRSFPGRLHLRSMKRGDLVLFYHSVSEKSVVGIARVDKEAYPDPTADEGDWSCVDLVPVKPLVQPVGLAAIKSDAVLKNIGLVKQSRLSVVPLTAREFEKLLKLGDTKV